LDREHIGRLIGNALTVGNNGSFSEDDGEDRTGLGPAEATFVSVTVTGKKLD
jgi:hypothetical protein